MIHDTELDKKVIFIVPNAKPVCLISPLASSGFNAENILYSEMIAYDVIVSSFMFISDRPCSIFSLPHTTPSFLLSPLVTPFLSSLSPTAPQFLFDSGCN